MDREEFIKRKAHAIITKTLDDYVILRKDEQGYYIEYAFQEGAPHDNRCLSWYDSYQENAYIRNGWVKGLSEEDKKKRLDALKKKIDVKVGQLFRLVSYTCGFEEYLERRLEESKESWENYHPDEPFVPEDHICKVGNPAKKCRSVQCKNWTYKEPVKCACWNLNKIEGDPDNLGIHISQDKEFIDLLEKLMKEV